MTGSNMLDRSGLLSMEPLRFSNLSEGAMRSGEWESRIAPPGVPGSFCFGCNKYLDAETLNTMLGLESALMMHDCGSALHTDLLGLDLRHDQLTLLDDATLRSQSWFHVTRKKNWHDLVSRAIYLGHPMVHLGSREAAMDRFRDLVREDSAQPYFCGSYYLIEVRLQEDAPVAPGLAEDAQENWPDFSGEVEEDFHNHRYIEAGGITRYLNRYEAPGTISLLANASVITVVEQQQLHT